MINDKRRNQNIKKSKDNRKTAKIKYIYKLDKEEEK